ncbi:short transient receptor potential channel 4-like [Saccoglossus kowalevskii]
MSYSYKYDADNVSVEKIFLLSAERGDKKALVYALENARNFNINCRDSEGRTALVIAIQNGSADIIRILIQHGVELGDSLLYAVDAQFTEGVQILCDHIRKLGMTEYLYCRSLNGDLHPDITPIILAAHHNNYEIIKILLDFGVRIEDPEYYTFQSEDITLQHSLGLLNVYKGLASQAYIALTSEDPINTAFELGMRLCQHSKSDYEFRYEFEELAEQCEDFSAALLGHVRDSTEQEVVLNHDPEEWAMLGDRYVGQPSKVKKAIKCKQVKFVAHPHCQQHLIERWYHGLPGWRKFGPWKKTFLTLLMGLCFPIFNISYIILPRCKLSKTLQIPYVKFVCYTASNLTFLVLLALQAMEFGGKQLEMDNIIQENNDGCTTASIGSIVRVSFSEWLVVFWVIGFTASECQDIWHKGFKTVTDNFSLKLFDFITMALYWTWIIIRFSVCLETHTGRFNETGTVVDEVSEIELDINGTAVLTNLVNDHFGVIDFKLDNITAYVTDISNQQKQLPGLIAEQITDAVAKHAKVLHRSARAARATARRRVSGGTAGSTETGGAYFVSARSEWDTFDPGLVAESLFAIAKVFSFLRLIRITVVNVQLGPMQISLGRMTYDIVRFLAIFCLVWFAFSVGLNQLYWFYDYEKTEHCKASKRDQQYEPDCDSVFGSIPSAMITLFWALFGIADMEHLKIEGAHHWYTEGVGRILFAAYHVIGIVVLLNILIAMMSNTFTRIEEDADRQWKFSRSRLWMIYFEDLSCLAPPFNIFPNTDLWFKLCKRRAKSHRPSVRTREKNYQVVVQQLVRRYLFDIRRSGDDDDGQDPVRLFRQEMSSLKYEMFEALSDMELKLKDLKTRLDSAEPSPKMGHKGKYDEHGSEMFHALQDSLSPPQAAVERTSGSPTESSSVYECEDCDSDAEPDDTPQPRRRSQKVSFEDDMDGSSSYVSIERDMNLSDLESSMFTTSGSESILGDLREPITKDYVEVFNHNLPNSLRLPVDRSSTRKRGKRSTRRRASSDKERRPHCHSTESLDNMLVEPSIDPIILSSSPPVERKTISAMMKNMTGFTIMPLSERWGPMKFIDEEHERQMADRKKNLQQNSDQFGTIV